LPGALREEHVGHAQAQARDQVPVFNGLHGPEHREPAPPGPPPPSRSPHERSHDGIKSGKSIRKPVEICSGSRRVAQSRPRLTIRAIPGHGKATSSWAQELAIGTLVERTTRFTLLLCTCPAAGPWRTSHAIKTWPPTDRTMVAEAVSPMRFRLQRSTRYPAQLRRSLTWVTRSEDGTNTLNSASTTRPMRISSCEPA